jgi:hypothetical protein
MMPFTFFSHYTSLSSSPCRLKRIKPPMHALGRETSGLGFAYDNNSDKKTQFASLPPSHNFECRVCCSNKEIVFEIKRETRSDDSDQITRRIQANAHARTQESNHDTRSRTLSSLPSSLPVSGRAWESSRPKIQHP